LPLPTFPQLSDDEMKARLKPPSKKVRCVLDTDCRNEIDDQFALAWTLFSPDQVQLEACYAEPYSHECYRNDLKNLVSTIKSGANLLQQDDGSLLDSPSQLDVAHDLRSRKYYKWANALVNQGLDPDEIEMISPKTGMEKSYDEIIHVYELLEIDAKDKAFYGADQYLQSYDKPIVSEAVNDLIERAIEYKDEPLYVSAIGCVTNIASALIIAPEIVKNIVVLWTAAYPTSVRVPNSSFNLDQDILAAQLLFDSGVPYIYLPGYHVGAQLTLSLPDMEAWIRDKGKLGHYLYNEYLDWYDKRQQQTHVFDHDSYTAEGMSGYTKVIWDLINMAWLINPTWVSTQLIRAPKFGKDTYWDCSDANRHLIREAYDIDRDGIFQDLIEKFRQAP